MYGNQDLSIFSIYMNTGVLLLHYKIFLRKIKKTTTVQVKTDSEAALKVKNILFNVLPLLTCMSVSLQGITTA